MIGSKTHCAEAARRATAIERERVRRLIEETLERANRSRAGSAYTALIDLLGKVVRGEKARREG